MKDSSHYFSWLLGIIDTSGIVRSRASLTRRWIGKTEGYVLAPVEGGFAHYQRPDGYYLRYDKLERPFDDAVKRILESQQHLQVLHPAPRFPTHSTNLYELLTLVKYNFYA